MGILSWIAMGLIAGLLARLLLPGRDPAGLWVAVIVGIVGALVGGLLATWLGFGGISGFDLRSVAIATLGGIVFLVVVRLLKALSQQNP